ncbi:hypothetical protein VP01_861g5 [Puccinia sorghi]|uniref:Amino acid transporter transmembrane domain-containing protein n=1 Tax=Puccinia sorghi TaxID=27349 RepID=A0A0L6U8V3_9BASI|nr:hypothetical protein VP01_861g5 [Puccinia sorghi]
MDDTADRECLLNAVDRAHEAPNNTEPGSIQQTPSQRAQQKAGLNYPPRLASTIASRECAFEADSDTVSVAELVGNVIHREEGSGGLNTSLQSGLKGLVATGKRRGSLAMTDSDSPSYMFRDDSEAPLIPQSRPKNGPSSPEDSDDYSHLLDSGTGMMAGVANMANSILGAGIIGLPYALRNAGFFTGTVMVIVLGFVTDWSIRLIALNSKMTGQRSYIGILEQCFGFPGKAAVSFFQFIFAFGGMCAFGVIVAKKVRFSS